jgi:hypothetical protein
MSRLRTFIALGRATLVRRVLRGEPSRAPAPPPRFLALSSNPRAATALLACTGAALGVCVGMLRNSGQFPEPISMTQSVPLVLVGGLLGLFVGVAVTWALRPWPRVWRCAVLFAMLMLSTSLGAQVGWVMGDRATERVTQHKAKTLDGMGIGSAIGFLIGLGAVLLYRFEQRVQREQAVLESQNLKITSSGSSRPE